MAVIRLEFLYVLTADENGILITTSRTLVNYELTQQFYTHQLRAKLLWQLKSMD